MSILWALLPDQFLPLVIPAIGLAVILRILNLRKAAAMIGGFCLLILSAPFVDALIGALPFWIILLMLPILAFALLGSLVRLMIGNGATDHLVGSLAADAIKTLLFLPFRILGLLLRRRN